MTPPVQTAKDKPKLKAGTPFFQRPIVKIGTGVLVAALVLEGANLYGGFRADQEFDRGYAAAISEVTERPVMEPITFVIGGSRNPLPVIPMEYIVSAQLDVEAAQRTIMAIPTLRTNIGSTGWQDIPELVQECQRSYPDDPLLAGVCGAEAISAVRDGLRAELAAAQGLVWNAEAQEYQQSGGNVLIDYPGGPSRVQVFSTCAHVLDAEIDNGIVLHLDNATALYYSLYGNLATVPLPVDSILDLSSDVAPELEAELLTALRDTAYREILAGLVALNVENAEAFYIPDGGLIAQQAYLEGKLQGIQAQEARLASLQCTEYVDLGVAQVCIAPLDFYSPARIIERAVLADYVDGLQDDKAFYQGQLVLVNKAVEVANTALEGDGLAVYATLTTLQDTEDGPVACFAGADQYAADLGAAAQEYLDAVNEPPPVFLPAATP
ncbi:MAG: hypothetical protein V1820_03220 [archaeon]